MVTVTYPYAWGDTRLTMAELEAKSTIQNTHPEFWRRLKAMLEAGEGRLGVGTCWRSSDVQRNAFLDRHYVVTSGGCCGYEGRRYQLAKGKAHAAPPGKSFHESTFHGSAQACDAVGDLGWMHSVEADYGLKDFRGVGNEPWHIQLVEIPNSVTKFKAAGSPQPTIWNLPGTAAPVTALCGPDVSAWQIGIVPPEPHGIGFGLCRASIGLANDPTAAQAIAWCRVRDVPFAAYHFVYEQPKHPAVDQALTFHESVGGDRSICCMLDWESDTDDNCHPGGEPQHPTWDDVLAVADAIRELGHRCNLVYTGRWYWNEQGSPTLAGCGLDLVNSNYGLKPWPDGGPVDVYTARGGDDGPGWAGYGGLDPILWQYSCQTTWGNRRVDFNAYKGDPAELNQWFTTWKEDEVTEADIEAIARRAAQLVWQWKVDDIVTEEPMQMQTMIRYTRAAVNKIDNQVS
jgi:Glycosyl hydrolases family 25